MRNAILAIAVLLSFLAVAPAQQRTTINQVPIKRTSWASGREMFREYCAACHGENGAGEGPAASACTVKPADLTTLAKRNRGKFSYDGFYAVLQFGTQTRVPAHGSADMPVWLPLFASLNEGHEALAEQRMYNLARYVASLQSK